MKEIINNYVSLMNEIRSECKSRSGLIDKDSTGGDGPTFDLITLTTFNKIGDWFFNLLIRKENGELSQKEVNQLLKEEYINTFMILHHKIMSKSKKFNWND